MLQRLRLETTDYSPRNVFIESQSKSVNRTHLTTWSKDNVFSRSNLTRNGCSKDVANGIGHFVLNVSQNDFAFLIVVHSSYRRV